MKDDNIASRLAKTAAEKRAQGWLYGGGPYGGYGGFGGYGGMNPYLGGMGYGGYGGGYGGGGYGGYGGRFGGVPMMAQSYANPYGRGGYYGMDPRFADPMVQQMNLQNQLQMYGAPRGIDIGLQGQQAGALGALQEQPALRHQQQLAELGAGQSFQAQPMGDEQLTRLEKQLEAARQQRQLAMTQLDPLVKEISTIGKPYAEERAKHEEAIQRLAGASGMGGGLDWAILQAQERNPQAQALLKRLNYPHIPKISDFRAAYARSSRGIAPEYTSALNAMRQLETLDQRRSDALEAQLKQRGILQAQERQAGGQIETTEEELRQRTLAIQAAKQRAGEEAYGRRGQTFDPATKTMRNVADIATKQVAQPTAPGRQPRHAIPKAPTVGLRPPATIPPATPATPTKPIEPSFTSPLPPPSGGMGPRGAAKHASIRHALSLTELADVAARVHLEKRAAMPGFTPGATTRTGTGKRITATPELFENLRQSVLPSIAKTATPRPDVSGVMQSLGLTGMPTTLAHLPVESAIGMGITAEQHSALRKALGLS